MVTLYRYTNTNMSGWEFVKVFQYEHGGEIGMTLYEGNSASTAENMSIYDLDVIVKSKSELRKISNRLIELGAIYGGRR